MMRWFKHALVTQQTQNIIRLLFLLRVFGWLTGLVSFSWQLWPQVVYATVLTGPAVSRSLPTANAEPEEAALDVLPIASSEIRGIRSQSDLLLLLSAGGVCIAGGYAIARIRQRPAKPRNPNLQLGKGSQKVPIGIVRVVTEATGRRNAPTDDSSLRLLADGSSDFLLLLDPNLNIVYANSTLTANLAISQDEICGTPVLDYFVKEDRERAIEFFSSITASGLDLDHQAPLLRMGRCTDQTPVPLVFNAYTINNSAAHPPASIACIARNRSFEVLLSNQLRQSRQELDALISNTAAGIVKIRTDGTLLECNDRFEKITGYKADEMKDMRFASLVYPEDLPAGRERFLKLAAGEIDRYEVDKRLVDRQGNVIRTKVTVSLIRSETGEPSHTVSVIELLTGDVS